MAAAAGSRVSGLLGQFPVQLAQLMSSGTHGKESSADMWKALTYLDPLPGVGREHAASFLKSHHGEHERPESIAYLHLCIRSKPFP